MKLCDSDIIESEIQLNGQQSRHDQTDDVSLPNCRLLAGTPLIVISVLMDLVSAIALRGFS